MKDKEITNAITVENPSNNQMVWNIISSESTKDEEIKKATDAVTLSPFIILYEDIFFPNHTPTIFFVRDQILILPILYC